MAEKLRVVQKEQKCNQSGGVPPVTPGKLKGPEPRKNTAKETGENGDESYKEKCFRNPVIVEEQCIMPPGPLGTFIPGKKGATFHLDDGISHAHKMEGKGGKELEEGWMLGIHAEVAVLPDRKAAPDVGDLVHRR